MSMNTLNDKIAEAQERLDLLHESEVDALTAKCDLPFSFKGLPPADERGRCPDCKGKVDAQFGNCKCTNTQ